MPCPSNLFETSHHLMYLFRVCLPISLEQPPCRALVVRCTSSFFHHSGETRLNCPHVAVPRDLHLNVFCMLADMLHWKLPCMRTEIFHLKWLCIRTDILHLN